MASWRDQTQYSYFQEVAEGRVPKHSSLHKFGAKDSVSTVAFEHIWTAGSDLTYLTSASTIHLISSNAGDNQASTTGARSVHVFGLDANFNYQDEILLLNATDGTLAGPSTTNTYIRLYRAYVEAAGAYGVTNLGNISVIEDNTSTTQAYLGAGLGQTEMTHFTIPTGYTGYIKRVSVSLDTGKNVDLRMIIRENADVTSAPTSPTRIIHFWKGLDAALEEVFFSGYILPEKTDFRFDGMANTNTGDIQVDYDIILNNHG